MPNNNVPDLKTGDIKRLARRQLTGRWTMAIIPMMIIMLVLFLPTMAESIGLSSLDWTNLDFSDTASMTKEIENATSGGPLSTVLSILTFFCAGPFALSGAVLGLRILRKEDCSAATAFEGFHHYLQSFFAYILVAVYSLLWGLCTIFPGTIVLMLCALNPVLLIVGVAVFIAAFIGYIWLTMRYSMVYFIASDDRSLPSSLAVKYSVALMKGRIGKYFLLQLSFIGWLILAAIPAAIGAGFMAASATDTMSVKMIAVCLFAVSFVAVSVLEVYIYTSNAVFYSTVSGNFGVAGFNEDQREIPAGQNSGMGQAGPNGQDDIDDHHDQLPGE